MAITQIAGPDGKIVTGYNPVVFVADSTNKNELGFQYIYDIYSAGTTNLLGSFYVSPRINDGYGVIDLSSFLQSYLTYDFGGPIIRDSWVKFDVSVGESYSDFWPYLIFSGVTATGTTNGYTALNSILTHPYQIGDQIFITQDSSSVFASLEGLHTVKAVPSSTTIIVDVPYVAYPSTTGTTKFANNTRIYDRDLSSFDNYLAVNGAVPFSDKFLDATLYSMTPNSSKLFLTNCPNGVYKRRDEDMYFNVITNNNAFNASSYLRITTSNGGDYIQNIALSGEPMIQVAIGPNNITGTTISGTQPIIQSGTTWYEFKVVGANSATTSSEIFRINIDDRCPIDYDDEEVSICFLDRLGSIGSFAFPMRRYDNTSVTRSSFNKQSGFIDSGLWDYSLEENGTTIYNVDLKRTLTLNTDWMNEADGLYFAELISSPATWIKWKGTYQRCDVVETNSENLYHRNKTLIRKTIQVNFSNNDNINI
jgi:hypothetical protein